MIKVDIPLRCLDRLMPEHLLEDVQSDAGVSHPRRPRVPEAVPGEVRQTEARDEVIPVGRIPALGESELASLYGQRVGGSLVALVVFA
jgi:hypothetical protein